MNDYFKIPDTYQSQELSFTSRLLMTGYPHKIEGEVDGQLILFEPDEDQSYRAIADQAPLEKGVKVNAGLFQVITEVIESTRM